MMLNNPYFRVPHRWNIHLILTGMVELLTVILDISLIDLS